MSESKETPASLGREIGAIVRESLLTGEPPDESSIHDAVILMLDASGDTAADALALLTMARTLSCGHPSRRWLVQRETSPGAVLLMQLMDRAVDVLEKAAGAKESAFSGFDAGLN